MPFSTIGPMQQQFGVDYATLQSRNSFLEKQMRDAELQNLRESLLQLMQIEDQKKAAKKAKRRKNIALGVGAGAGAVGGFALAPALFAGGAAAAGTTLGGGALLGSGVPIAAAVGPTATQSILSTLIGSGYGANIAGGFQ